jgi:hypothetical protein
MWLYFSADDATADPWNFLLVLLWLPLFPTLAHSLSAFVWGRRFTARPWWLKAALYAPFLVLLPVVLGRPDNLERIGFLFGLAFTVALLPFLVLVALKLRRSKGVERMQSKYMLAYLSIALGFAAEARAIPFLIEGARFPHWELAIAFTVATAILLYGILKSHLFDIDLRIKWTLRQGTLAGVFVAAFFVASEATKATFEDWTGHAFVGIAAAAMLLFALAPLQRFSDRVANAALPHVRALGDLDGSERARLYEEQVRFAWADGTLEKHERALLEHLRERLGLSREEAGRLEQRALRA